MMAKMGLNQLLLYTEETYEVPEYPYFGIYRGRYSKEELQEIDRYAALFGIELVPCIQTLAHLGNFLKWHPSAELKDSSDILLVGEEKVYLFIETLLRTIKETFTTRRIHLGMDEAVFLGLGNYLKQHGYRPGSQLLKEHCDRVLHICQKLELEPMMWSDMFITSNSNCTYYDHHDLEEVKSWLKPEKGLGLVYWDYYNDNESIYENMMQTHKILSDDLTFAGGSWIWNGIAPNYSRTFKTAIPALTYCKKYHISNIFCTAWQDNGSETPLDAVLPGIVLFAHLGFHKTLDQNDLSEEFRITVNGNLEDFYQLEAFDSMFVGMGNNMTSDNPSKYLLYQDTMLGMFDYHIKDVDVSTYYETLAKKLKDCIQRNPDYQDLFEFYYTLAKVLSQKGNLGLRIKSAYDNHELSTLKQISAEVIPNLIADVHTLKVLREQIWLKDAKPFGFELLDIRLSAVAVRLESHARRINTYLTGAIERLEELEQVRMPYFAAKTSMGHDRTASLTENRWNNIISGCNMIDTI